MNVPTCAPCIYRPQRLISIAGGVEQPGACASRPKRAPASSARRLSGRCCQNGFFPAETPFETRVKPGILMFLFRQSVQILVGYGIWALPTFSVTISPILHTRQIGA